MFVSFLPIYYSSHSSWILFDPKFLSITHFYLSCEFFIPLQVLFAFSISPFNTHYLSWTHPNWKMLYHQSQKKSWELLDTSSKHSESEWHQQRRLISDPVSVCQMTFTKPSCVIPDTLCSIHSFCSDVFTCILLFFFQHCEFCPIGER